MILPNTPYVMMRVQNPVHVMNMKKKVCEYINIETVTSTNNNKNNVNFNQVIINILISIKLHIAYAK